MRTHLIRMYVCVGVYMCVCVCVCMFVCMRVCMYKLIYVCAYLVYLARLRLSLYSYCHHALSSAATVSFGLISAHLHYSPLAFYEASTDSLLPLITLYTTLSPEICASLTPQVKRILAMQALTSIGDMHTINVHSHS